VVFFKFCTSPEVFNRKCHDNLILIAL
jgi:hypothetical protein